MATFEDIRRAVAGLPGARESEMLGEPAFKVGRKGFVHVWRGRIMMKLDRDHQELLFEARPDVFAPTRGGGMRWSWINIAALEADEVAVLVREAWTSIVPKKVSRAYLG